MGGVLSALAELVLGASCPGCGRVAAGLCPDCRAALTRPPTVVVEHGLTLAWAGAYADVLRETTLAAKERRALQMATMLGGLLARAVAALAVHEDAGGPLVLVPVPTVRAHVLRRGVDLPRLLAAGAARRLRGTGLDVRVVGRLSLARTPVDQIGLDAAARRRNLAGAFVWRGPTPAGRVIVVDDILTTGATMTQAAAACRRAGASVLGGAVVARTPRRAPGRDVPMGR